MPALKIRTTLVVAAALSLAVINAKGDTQDAAPAKPPVVTTRAILGGAVYADAKGKTLYTSDKDTKPGKSICVDACAREWRPLPVAWAADAVGDWSVIQRDDGTRQWAYKGKPLYTFTGDLKPGDTKGDGADNAWRALVSTHKFIPAGVTIKAIPNSDLGHAFTTADGMTLYIITKYKTAGTGNSRYRGPNPGIVVCNADCARTWVPLKAPADAKPADDWTVIARDDGTMQWAYKGFPLYTYVKDAKPGDALGEGVDRLQDGLTDWLWEVATISV